MQTKWFDEELNLKFNRNVLARHPRKTARSTKVWRDNLPRCSLSSADPKPRFLLYSVSTLSRFWKYNCPRCFSPYFAFPASNQHRTTSSTNVVKSINNELATIRWVFLPRSVSLTLGYSLGIPVYLRTFSPLVETWCESTSLVVLNNRDFYY